MTAQHGSDSGSDSKGEGLLYVVATPIGNLGDMTFRAVEVLRNADLVAAEDTRVTARLLNHFGLTAQLLSVREHNERAGAQKILDALGRGQRVAMVTDAGTPAVSDPGAYVVAAARAAGFRVIPIPGASAVVTTLSASGFAAPHFLFYGFLPAKPGERRRALESLRELPYVLAFYEAPHRIREALADMAAVLGPMRGVVIARELTKLYEQIHACTLAEAVAWLDADPNRERGEFALLVDGATEAGAEQGESRRVLEILLRELPVSQAARLAAEITGGKRKLLYELALELKGEP
jgi:16S rRNA (cytidine1402-2'-O)-methyltransferase